MNNLLYWIAMFLWNIMICAMVDKYIYALQPQPIANIASAYAGTIFAMAIIHYRRKGRQ